MTIIGNYNISMVLSCRSDCGGPAVSKDGRSACARARVKRTTILHKRNKNKLIQK